MIEIPDGKKASQNETSPDLHRRQFIRGAAATAGMLGAVGMPPAALGLSAAASPQQVQDPPKPPGLKPPAMLGSKYLVCFKESVPAAMRVMIDYFAALSSRDLRGMADCLIYPHASYEAAQCVVVNSADELLSSPPPSMNVTGKGEHLIQAGAYDIMDNIQVYLYNPVRVCLAFSYSRFQPSGQKILQCDGMYYVTNNDGKWGIELASTIFTPLDQIGVNYKNAEQSFLDMERAQWLAVTLKDIKEGQSSSYSPGKQAGYIVQPLPDIEDARDGNPMKRYHAKGVKNRMVISEVTEGYRPAAPGSKAGLNYFDQVHAAYGEAIGQYAVTLVTPWAHVVHSSINKIHVYTGLIRYTTDWKQVLDLRHVNFYTYKYGKWGHASSSDAQHYLDYDDTSNDVSI